MSDENIPASSDADDSSPIQLDAELVKLLIEWINTPSWEQSQAFLSTHSEQLLSDKARETLMVLLLMEMSEDDEGEQAGESDELDEVQQRKITTLQQHLALLEQAHNESINAAYATRHMQAAFSAALNALLQADTPYELSQVLLQHPILREDAILQAADALALQMEQNGDSILAQGLRLRLNQIRQQRAAMQMPREQQAPLVGYPASEQIEDPVTIEQRAGHHNIVVERNSGSIDQTNVTVNEAKLPPKQWLSPQTPKLPRRSFIGRKEQLNDLCKILLQDENVVITSSTSAAMLHGMGGIGKTYLATKAAQEVSTAFPGGVIPVTLGPSIKKKEDAQSQLHELASYAFDGDSLPLIGQLLPSSVAGWLGKMAPGRLLVIFDDVWHSEPLLFLRQALPANAVYMITTRDAHLAIDCGGKPVHLDRLSEEDSIALLEDRLGCKDDMTYRNDIRAVATLLGGHALALEIAAARTKEPRRLRMMRENLEQRIGRGTLEGLSISSDTSRDTDVESALEVSYQEMSDDEQRHFRFLGVFAPETPITVEAAAAVWAMDDMYKAQDALLQLVDLALLDEREGGAGQDDEGATTWLYRQHNLLHVYAHALLERAGELETAQWSHASYYKDMAVRAFRAKPRNYPLLDLHFTNLHAALVWSETHESALFSQLVEYLFQFLQLRGQIALLKDVLPKAIEAAAKTGNTVRQANVLQSLGDLERRLGNIEAARAHYDAALPLYEREQDRLGQANVLQSLGDLESRLGNIEAARTHYDAALPLYEREQDRLGQANVLQSLGDLESRLGNIEAARAHYDAALPLYEREQDRLGQANVYLSMADMLLAQQDMESAKTYYEQALPLFIAEQDPLGQANTLIDLGRVRFMLGDHEQGMEHVQRAAKLFRRVQSEEWAQRAEQLLAAMQAALNIGGVSQEQAALPELLMEFLGVGSSQEMLEFVQEHPQCLTDKWIQAIEQFVESQDDAEMKEAIGQRLETVKQIRAMMVQRVSEVSQEVLPLLNDFAQANWSQRRRLLDERADILLSEQVEQVFDFLMQRTTDSDTRTVLESLRTLLRRCRTWGVDAVFYFAPRMRLGDTIPIPLEYEETVMQVARLLANPQRDDAVLVEAIEMMQHLLDRLTSDTPPLFEAALLRDIAETMELLPARHPRRTLSLIERYYREALPLYQAGERPVSVAFIQRSLGTLLSDQGRYEEALAFLQAASQELQRYEDYKHDAAWSYSAYASALDWLGRADEALAAYNEALRLLPDTPALLRNRSEACIHLGKFSEAEADLERAVQLDGDERSPYLWYHRAQLALARGNAPLAEQMLQEVLQRDARFDVRLLQAQLAWLQGSLSTAQDFLRQAVEKANPGERAFMQLEMERLHQMQPSLAGWEEVQQVFMQ